MRRTLFFLLLLLLPSASAEFTAFGTSDHTAIVCNSFQSNLTIQNIGQEQAAYGITVDGTAADFVGFSAIEFSLNPGQTASVTAFYFIPCDTPAGVYDLSIFFTDGVDELELPVIIDVQFPSNINLTTTTPSQVITPCSKATYDITLFNPLGFPDIYTLSASGHPNVHLTETIIVLEPLQERSIQLSVSPDDCTQTGSFPLTLLASAEQSRQQHTLDFDFIIKATDIPVLAEGTTAIRTDIGDNSAPITIENTGDRQTTYTLTLQGPPWATISPTTLNLEPGQQQTIFLRFTPDENVPRGTYLVTITATVQQTGIQYSKDIRVNVGPPTLIESNPVLAALLLVVLIALAIGIVSLVRYTRTKKFQTRYEKWQRAYHSWKIKNAANRAKRIAERARRKKEKEQRKKELLALKEKAKQQTAQQRAKQDALRQKELEKKRAQQERILSAAQLRAEKKLRKTHLLLKKEKPTTRPPYLSILLLVLGLLLLLAISPFLSQNIEAVISGAAVLIILLLLRYATTRTRKSFKAHILRDDKTFSFWKLGLTSIHVSPKEPLQHFALAVKKLASQPASYQTFDIASSTENLSANFAIPQRWLSKLGAKPESIKLRKRTAKGWTSVPITVHDLGKTITFTAILEPGTYTITAQPTSAQPRQHKIAGILIALGLLAAVAVVLAPPTTDGISAQHWPANTVHQLDLKPYFNDPDGDTLTFQSTRTDHIDISIVDGVAFFTPEQDWTGEERIQILANDSEQITRSNIIPLVVEHNLVPPSIYPAISTGIALLAVILLLFSLRTLRK